MTDLNLYKNKTIASFDVGIKHLAYCVFKTTNPITILDWNIIDLTKPQNTVIRVCGCKKNAKNEQICNKAGEFKKDENIYCLSHAKKHADFIFNDKKLSVASLKKLNLSDLIKLCTTYNISICVDSETASAKTANKPILLERIITFVKGKALELLNADTTRSTEINMINIGRIMKKTLNETVSLDNVDIVLIENQIGPLARRMKDVQILLTQYFIMKRDETLIVYVSSSNKLKLFSSIDTNTGNINTEQITSGGSAEKIKKQVYTKHKKDAVIHTKHVIGKNASLLEWVDCLESAKKKDDYADSFLQGLWYLHAIDIIKINNYILRY